MDRRPSDPAAGHRSAFRGLMAGLTVLGLDRLKDRVKDRAKARLTKRDETAD